MQFVLAQLRRTLFSELMKWPAYVYYFIFFSLHNLSSGVELYTKIFWGLEIRGYLEFAVKA